MFGGDDRLNPIFRDHWLTQGLVETSSTVDQNVQSFVYCLELRSKLTDRSL